VHPVLKPSDVKIEKTDDALINSFRESEAYMKRNKAAGKVAAMEDNEEMKSQKMDDKGGVDFETDLKLQ